jgi:hypothetical protein
LWKGGKNCENLNFWGLFTLAKCKILPLAKTPAIATVIVLTLAAWAVQ